MNKSADSDIDYSVRITKPSKYKKLDTWLESSGELSSEEIQLIFKCDNLDKEKDECSKGEELPIISDEVVDFINEHAPRHKVSEEYKTTKIFNNN